MDQDKYKERIKKRQRREDFCCLIIIFHIISLRNMDSKTAYEIREDMPPPEKLIKTARLDSSLRGLKPGQSVLLARDMANCLVQYFRYHKLKHTQRKDESGLIRVWRLE